MAKNRAASPADILKDKSWETVADTANDKSEKEKGGYQAAEEFSSPLMLDTNAQIISETQVEIDLQQDVEYEKE